MTSSKSKPTQLAQFDNDGRPRTRILITRAREQASQLADSLEQLGAETILVPTIGITEPASFEELDGVIRALGGPAHAHGWLLFTSANAVHALARRAHALGVRVQASRIGVIGPATAKAVADAGLLAVNGRTLIPPQFVAESLAEALLSEQGEMSESFTLVRAEDARDVVPAMLLAAGHKVSVVSAYRNATPPETVSLLQDIFASPENYPEIVTFTSSSTVRNLVALLEVVGVALPDSMALASIGPITSATLHELGYKPTIEAAEATIDSLVAAISEYLASRRAEE